ncbi:MAG: response regulator [Motiliproteus sp.]
MRPLKRILHVDDEADIRVVTALALEALGGYSVESCASGVQALAAIEAFAPDLIILDVMMPGMDGPATLLKLRKLHSQAQVPVVFMTAKVQSQEIVQYLSLGASGVITKPFDPQTLSHEIEAIWTQVDAASS